MKLFIGVNDVPEFESQMPLIDVARILEDKYELFTAFATMNQEYIEGQLVAALEGQIPNILAGKSPSSSPFQGALEKIENRFQEALTRDEFAGKLPGVPTGVAQANKSRIRGAKRRGPSFVDTATLRTNLRVWTKGAPGVRSTGT